MDKLNWWTQWWERFLPAFEEQFWNPYYDRSQVEALLKEAKEHVK